MLAMLILVFVMPVILLIHLIAMVYCYKKDYFRSKAFTYKYLIIALLAPAAGSALITFEYWINREHGGIHVGTFLSVLFVYGFLALLFTIPYILYLTAASKNP